jgi:O-antigen/teichoic acid export membrane protein
MLKDQLKGLLKHGGIYGLGRILSRAVGFLMIPVYTRCLTPQDYGVIELIDLFLTVLGLMVANGINSSIFKFYYHYDDQAQKRRVVSTALITVTAVGLALTAGGLFLAGRVSHLLFDGGGYATYIRMAFITFLFNLMGDMPMGYLRARQKSVLYSAVSLSRLAFEVSLNIVLVVWLRMGIKGVLTTQLVSSMLFSTFLAVVTFRETGMGVSRELALKMLRFGVPLIPSNVGMFIINNGDRFFLKHFGTLDDVGVYSLGYKFGYMVSYLALQPFMLIWDAKMYEVAKQPDAERTYGRIFTYLVLLMCFAGLGMSLFIRPVIHLMTAPSFWPAASIVPLIVLAYVFQAFYYFFQVGLYLKGKTEQVGGIILLTGAATLALYWILIRSHFAMGAAVATALSFLLLSVLMLAVSQRAYRILYEWGRIARAFGVAAGLYLIHLLVPAGAAWTALAADAALFLAYPALLVLLGFFNDSERNWALGFLRGRGWVKSPPGPAAAGNDIS